MYTTQPERQRPGWVLFVWVDDEADTRHGITWKGGTDEPGRVAAKGREQLVLRPSFKVIASSETYSDRQRGMAYFCTSLPESDRAVRKAAA